MTPPNADTLAHATDVLRSIVDGGTSGTVYAHQARALLDALDAGRVREALAMEQATVAREEAQRWRADYHTQRTAIEAGGAVERVTYSDDDGEEVFDELVAHNVNVHIERMSDSVVWMSVHDRVLHFFTARGRAPVLVSVEQDASRMEPSAARPATAAGPTL